MFLGGIDKAKQMSINEEIVDIISEYTDEPWFKFQVKEEGVYRIEYTKNVIDSIIVCEKPKLFFQHTRLVEKTRDLYDKRWIELFYFEKNKTYYINLALKPYLKYGTYTLKVIAHEVPANNYKESAKVIDLNKCAEGRFDYITDVDWFTFVAPETATYKITYSREIADVMFIYEGENKKPECPVGDKIYLVNNTIVEPFAFEEGKEYFIKVEHLKQRTLAKYSIRFKKVEEKDKLLELW